MLTLQVVHWLAKVIELEETLLDHGAHAVAHTARANGARSAWRRAAVAGEAAMCRPDAGPSRASAGPLHNSTWTLQPPPTTTGAESHPGPKDRGKENRATSGRSPV